MMTITIVLVLILIIIIVVSLSAADARGVHASTNVVGGAGTPRSVRWLVSMLVEDAPGGGGRKTDVVES